MNEKSLMLLRRRFVKDFNLPINIVDDPYFGYYMRAYDFFPREDYVRVLSDIREKYDDNIDAWLQHYADIRDRIITTIENSEAYKRFNEMDIKPFRDFSDNSSYRNVRDLNIYNNENTGGIFVSIDLKKANFQALRYIDPEIVFGCETYEELMEMFGGDDYFKKSKYTRQVIFGKLNPKRTITVEKYLMYSICEDERNVNFRQLIENTELVTIKSDEIIFRVDPQKFEVTSGLLTSVMKEIKENNGLDVRAEVFKLERIVCTNHNGTTVDGYIRRFYLDGKRYDLKNVSSIFFPQVYAFCKGRPLLSDYDLVFRAEDQIAKFLHPLEFNRIEGE